MGYHETIGEDLNAGVAEGSGGEFKIAEVAGEDLGGHGHKVVDHIDDDGGGGEVAEELQFDPRGELKALPPRDSSVEEDSLQLITGFVIAMRRCNRSVALRQGLVRSAI
nr:hypothetical protein CCACVL1_16155 [Ipomoea batatas]